MSKAQAPAWFTVGEPLVPLCSDGACSNPGLPEYSEPTAESSSVEQSPGAAEQFSPDILNGNDSA
ncbi:hypothetical protein HFK18_12890|uniref:hypothetical protein n=1 Tax=Stenotrophomonas sp. SbOxS2 TaxID=2723885 RepID=UPI0015D22072|nr:hypothetical protein [Stenotrophomonas sp. SbOxS2]NYT99379.1 hypothetical protein [Stenotrophomonas sp. SbOxS2]